LEIDTVKYFSPPPALGDIYDKRFYKPENSGAKKG
jgi:hypothetical protein